MGPTAKLDLRNSYFGEGSVEVSPPPPEGGEGGIRRLAHAVAMLPHKNAVGWRDVVRVHEEKKVIKKVVDGEEREETKTWKYFELSDPKYWTFTEYREAIREAQDDVMNIYAQTSPNWQLFSQACSLISTAIATSYETLGQEGLAHSLNEPDCRAVFTNADLLPTLLKVLPDTPAIQYVFYDGAPDFQLLDKISALEREGGGKIQHFHVDALRQLGREHKEVTDEVLAERRPTPETNACIMYTSGSTGKPKGVQLTHRNLIASLASVNFLYGHHLPEDSVYLAYLPLAHVFEFIVELVAIYVGATAVYARPKTLTDQSVRNCKGDLTVYQPTIMLGVPAVWEQIRKGIVGKLDQMGWVTKTVVETAMTVKKKQVPVLSWLMDRYVLSGIRAPTGGSIRLGINGGAAISKDTQEFMSLAVMPLMQGYGMTESCGMCAILPPELHQYGAVGLPVPSLEVKLLDCPDMGYTSKNDPPQGEICIRGPSVSKGYFKRPDLNEDETIFTKDGWFRTGDVGQWNEDGTLSIVDRLKNLIKLQSGEYIALEKLESIYKSCDLVSNVCVYASQDADQPIAIIVPNERNLRQAVKAAGSADSTTNLPDLCKDKAVRKLVLNACNEIGKKNKFKPAELLKGVILTAEEWTPENGLVTAAQKVNRGAVSKVFRDEIGELYSS
ncbi:acyl-CoA synthetase [Ephemerocybe angulata]|uniref:Acyl-CoA synthetase n=1 Tax=Ephemerocybe angulata TaxID=980116 RepID=A0A8H6IDY7_9AGAR|nr:acyl-CoA synthetase [Tulosesus angulatus]